MSSDRARDPSEGLEKQENKLQTISVRTELPIENPLKLQRIVFMKFNRCVGENRKEKWDSNYLRISECKSNVRKRGKEFKANRTSTVRGV